MDATSTSSHSHVVGRFALLSNSITKRRIRQSSGKTAPKTPPESGLVVQRSREIEGNRFRRRKCLWGQTKQPADNGCQRVASSGADRDRTGNLLVAKRWASTAKKPVFPEVFNDFTLFDRFCKPSQEKPVFCEEMRYSRSPIR